jgi:flagellar hook-associated protein 1 FlgK
LVSGNANEIRDQRDKLVRDLSSQIGITYKENSDGTTDINYADGGAALVTGSTAGSFSLTTDGSLLSDGVTLKNIVNLTPAGSATAAVVTPTTGQLGAVMYLRDDTTGGIPNYLAQVDALAKTIIDEVNAVHSAGYQQDGVTAGTNFFTGATAADMAVNLTATTQIAASGVAGLTGDNSNALKLAQLQNKLTMSGNTTTFNSYFSSLVSKVGLDVQSIKNTESQDIAFTKQLTTLRESNSGVSLDEELTNLIKYQRSYQASAKLITTATEMMDTVINLIR